MPSWVSERWKYLRVGHLAGSQSLTPSRWIFLPIEHACCPHRQRHYVRDCDRDLAAETFYLARVRSPIAVEDLHIPMPASVNLQPRFPFGGLTISRCVNALIRQDLLDPLPYVRRHICGDWGDVRAEHRRYGDPPDIANRRVVTQSTTRP